MSLFAIEIKPNHVFHQPSLPYNLRLTMATLSQEHLVSETERTVLMFKTQGVSSALSMCALTPERHFQQPLDLLLDVGEELEFFVKGPNTITLLGNFLPDEDDEEEDDDSSSMYSDDIIYCEDGDEEMYSDEGYLESNIQEIDEQDEDVPTLVPDTTLQPLPESATKKAEESVPMDLKPQKATNQVETPIRSSRVKSKETDAVPPSKKKQTDDADQTPRPKRKAVAEVPTPKSAKRSDTKRKSDDSSVPSKKAKLEPVRVGQMQLLDLTEASPNAPKAKNGQLVAMRYIGRLHKTGQVFDMNAKGEPFKFRLGKNEVIRGWDQGIVGMAEGQRRKLIVPPELAYGKRGCPPDIPRNATLEFEVKLVKILSR